MKKNVKYWQSILYASLMICCVACTDNITTQNAEEGSKPRKLHDLYIDDIDGQGALYNMPLASINELDYYSGIDEEIIPYGMARQYAFIEFMENASSFLSEEAYDALNDAILEDDSIPIAFTNRPAIVYNYDEKPYYYEFGVIWEEQLQTVVTVYTHKMSDQLIAFVGAANYTDYDFEYKRYVGIYPSVYYGDGNMQPSMPVLGENNSMTMQAVEPPEVLPTNPFNLFTSQLSQLPQDERILIDEDLEEQTEMSMSEFGASIPSISSYMTLMTQLQAERMATLNGLFCFFREDSIGRIFHLTDHQRDLVKNIWSQTQSHTYYLYDYRSHQLRFTHWKRFCGPATMAWLFRGKWASFRGQYLPLYGESSPDNGTIEMKTVTGEYSYYKITDEQRDQYGGWVEASAHVDNGLCGVWYQYCPYLFGGYPLFPSGLKAGLEQATQDKSVQFTVKFTIVPRLWIKDDHEPVVIACMPGPDYEPHYLAAIGVTYNNGFLGIPKDRFFLVTDNGSQIANHGYYPYWRGYEWWNLHYGWKRMD